MTEVVWVALISAGGALVAAFMTQLLATRAAARQADRTERKEALQWQRSETTRRQQQLRADLRECWTLALQAQGLVIDSIGRLAPPDRALEHTATGAAARAYAVALVSIAAVRPQAKELHKAAAQLEFAPEGLNDERFLRTAWHQAFDALEVAIARTADDQSHPT